jgi:hypothetical protein
MHAITRTAFCLLCAAVALTAACRSDKPERKYREPIEGTAEAINVETGEVTMLWFNEKKNREVPLTGRVTDETEFFINGRSAKLTDIRIKERVRVSGFISGTDMDREYVVTRVEVERADEWIPTTASSQPAAARPG